ncbi:MAG: polysaccharide biosynthesis/export family protein [Desulfovibrio sp.]|jgi:polysaccharide export outer membrane protein|nr:polysaccharide biosynthesis/export family protein [Desulfovibrio sp.]
MKRHLLMLLCLVCLGAAVAGPAARADDAGDLRRMFETVAPGGYHVGAEDVLEVFVWGDESLTRQVMVRPDGYVSLPLIGEVLCLGRTVEDIREEVDRRYSKFITDTPVSIMIVEINSPKVYVIGKVNRPGVYLMPHPMTVTQALALAGGFNPFADDANILLVRGIGPEQKVYEYDYTDISLGSDMHQNVLLRPNDTIVVP